MNIQIDNKLNEAFYKGASLFAIIFWSYDILVSYSENHHFKISFFIHLIGACILLLMWILSLISKKIAVTLVVSTIVMIAELNWIIFNVSSVFNALVLFLIAIFMHIIVGIMAFFMGKKVKTIKNDKNHIRNAEIPIGFSGIAGGAYLFSKFIMPYDAKNIFLLSGIMGISLVYEYLLIRTITINNSK